MFTVGSGFFDNTSIADECIVSDLAANSKDCCGLLPGKQSIYISVQRIQNCVY